MFAATNLSVGFITEGGQLVQNYIQSGASTIFPVGKPTFLVPEMNIFGPLRARATITDAMYWWWKLQFGPVISWLIWSLDSEFRDIAPCFWQQEDKTNLTFEHSHSVRWNIGLDLQALSTTSKIWGASQHTTPSPTTARTQEHRSATFIQITAVHINARNVLLGVHGQSLLLWLHFDTDVLMFTPLHA